MIRVCEMMGVNAGGYAEIIKAIEKLGAKHVEHIQCYGEGTERRLTFESCLPLVFSWSHFSVL